MPYLISLLIWLFSSALYAEGQSDEGKPLSEFTPKLSAEFKTLLNQANIDKGERVFMRKCAACHFIRKDGSHDTGPHLWNILGRQAGTAKNFEYSKAMAESGHIWNFATLNYFLTRTDRAVPGRKMKFRGIRKDKDRANLLAYIRQAHDNPPPIPE